MTYTFYKKFLAVFFILFFPQILLNEIGLEIFWENPNHLLVSIIFYAYPFLSLILLYFGIYAHMCKIKTDQKIYSPLLLIILGSIFTVMSIGRPIAGFLLLQNINIKPFTTNELQSIRQTSLELTKSVEERLAAVKFYYLHKGESIEYFDENGNKIIFSPSKTDKEQWEKNVQMNQDIDRNISLSKGIAINLITFTVGSCLCFLILIKFKRPGFSSRRSGL